jgi:ubiquinone/menaquinone biosynthesis C-methylase UbiE
MERISAPSRRRYGAALFLGTRVRPLDHVVASAYFAAASGRWARYTAGPRHLAAFAEGLAAIPAPAAVLDVGTGTGGSAALVAAAHPRATVVAVDTSRRMLAEARARHGDVPNLRFERATVTRLPFPDASFDLVTGLNAVADPMELRRVLRRGGMVLVAATTMPLRGDDSDWVQRWSATGFARVAGGDVDGGSWEVYRESTVGATRPAIRAR